ncbi:MAG: methyltransferase domain-containing protein [Acidimicrobiales bacterium]
MTGADHRDQWAAWLAERRHGGDAESLRQAFEDLAPVRDRVIANAAIGPGSRVLDVGCGDGLIAFSAAEAVGPRGQVIFSDVSGDLIEACRKLAANRGLFERCRFVEAPARDLSPVPDDSVDAVTLRSVLIYETEKAQAFAEFHRVLRRGGLLSLFEPINSFAKPERPESFWGYEVGALGELANKLKALYGAIQPPDTDPMLNFDERDLVGLAEDAGFRRVHLRLEVDIERPKPRSWLPFLNSSRSPRIPTLAEAMAEALEPREADRFAAQLRPLVEQGHGKQGMAVAYLWAVR